MTFLETSLNRLIKIVDDQRWVGNILKTKSIKNLVNAYKDRCMNKMEEKHTLLLLKSVPHLFSPKFDRKHSVNIKQIE